MPAIIPAPINSARDLGRDKIEQISILNTHINELAVHLNAQKRDLEWLTMHVETLETTKAIAELAVANLKASL